MAAPATGWAGQEIAPQRWTGAVAPEAMRLTAWDGAPRPATSAAAAPRAGQAPRAKCGPAAEEEAGADEIRSSCLLQSIAILGGSGIGNGRRWHCAFRGRNEAEDVCFSGGRSEGAHRRFQVGQRPGDAADS